MQIEQTTWIEGHEVHQSQFNLRDTAQLVLAFGSGAQLQNGALAELRQRYPNATFLGCSTAGEIRDTRVFDDSLVATAVRFASTRTRRACVTISNGDKSRDAGRDIARQLLAPDLVHVLVLSDGLTVNGSELASGMAEALPARVSVTGGLSADGDRFKETLVISDGDPRPGIVAAVGLYGGDLRVGCGCLGGWDTFGPDRQVTRARGNVVYELDGRPALQLYKDYLGEQAEALPAAGMRFPLSVLPPGSETRVVRTLLAIDEADLSVTFAGDVPQGSRARLMKANVDRLVDGALGAAEMGRKALGTIEPDLAILISCVGRRLVLRQRVEEEVEGVRDALGARTLLTGFYSYGEISPFTPTAKCELHNQTMTITAITES